MYIEFYGLPGTGKSTFSSLLNKSLNRDPEWRYSPAIIWGVVRIYSRFMFLIMGKYFTDFDFFRSVMKKPIHFMAFLKGVLVRLIVLFRHERSGFFISDHGLIQTLGQNVALRKALLKDKKFLSNMLKLLPKKARYIYLKTDIPLSFKRVLKREKRHRFSYEFMLECNKFFGYVKNYFNSPTISTIKAKASIIKDMNTLLMRIGKQND